MDDASLGDLPITEHLRLALEGLPERRFSPDQQYDNVRAFLRRHVEHSGSHQLTRGDLRTSFPFGNYESNEEGWRRAIGDNLLDWDGYRFIIARRLLEPPKPPPWLRDILQRGDGNRQ